MDESARHPTIRRWCKWQREAISVGDLDRGPVHVLYVKTRRGRGKRSPSETWTGSRGRGGCLCITRGRGKRSPSETWTERKGFVDLGRVARGRGKRSPSETWTLRGNAKGLEEVHVAEGSDLRRRLGHCAWAFTIPKPTVWQREAISVGDLDQHWLAWFLTRFLYVAEGSDLRRRLGPIVHGSRNKLCGTVAEGSDLRRRLGQSSSRK